MKSLTTVLESAVTPLYESLLDDFDAIENKTNHRQEVADFITRYCRCSDAVKISSKPNKDGYYEVSTGGDITIGGDKLTNGLFIWKKVKGNFNCLGTKIETLEGSPEAVPGLFDCSGCMNLISLKGAPKKVGTFYCHNCKNLQSLEYGPIEVDDTYNCRNCDLKSLKGAPKKVGGYFDCSWNNNLISIEDAPAVCESGFNCSGCSKLKSLKGLPKHISKGTVRVSGIGITVNKKEIDWYPKNIKVYV